MSFRSIYYLIVFILFSVYASAQIENTNALRIDAEKEPKETTFSLPSSNSGISTESNFKLYSSSVDSLYANRMQRPFSMNNDNGLLRSDYVDLDKINTEHKEANTSVNTSNQYFGNFESNGNFVHLFYRDFGEEDSDMVRIYVDGNVYRGHETLSTSFKSLKINLLPGINTIMIEAINEGYAPPNTAEFHLYDHLGNLITADAWNLITGKRAIFSVFKK